MAPQEDQQASPSFSLARRTTVIAILCLGIAAAAVHANLSPVPRWTYWEDDGVACDWGFGWPFWYGAATTRPQFGSPPPPPQLPSELTAADAYYCAVDLFITCILVASLLVVGRTRVPGCLGRGQFTLSELFSTTTAVAMVLALFSVERTRGWAKLLKAGAVNSPLSSRPWFDQVLISLGIVCALYVAIAALCQAFRSVVVRLRNLRQNKL